MSRSRDPTLQSLLQLDVRLAIACFKPPLNIFTTNHNFRAQELNGKARRERERERERVCERECVRERERERVYGVRNCCFQPFLFLFLPVKKVVLPLCGQDQNKGLCLAWHSEDIKKQIFFFGFFFDCFFHSCVLSV